MSERTKGQKGGRDLPNGADREGLVDHVRAELPVRAAELADALADRRLEDLLGLSRRLRGSGVAEVDRAAADVEQALRSLPGEAEAGLVDLRRMVDELVETCRRAVR